MKVIVKIGRQFNKNYQKRVIEIEIPDGSSMFELCQILTDRFQIPDELFKVDNEGEKICFTNFIIKNNKAATPSDLLKSNDVIAILPNIVGG